MRPRRTFSKPVCVPFRPWASRSSSRKASEELAAYEDATARTPEFFFNLMLWEIRWPFRVWSEMKPEGLSEPMTDYIKRAEAMNPEDYRRAVTRREDLPIVRSGRSRRLYHPGSHRCGPARATPWRHALVQRCVVGDRRADLQFAGALCRGFAPRHSDYGVRGRRRRSRGDRAWAPGRLRLTHRRPGVAGLLRQRAHGRTAGHAVATELYQSTIALPVVIHTASRLRMCASARSKCLARNGCPTMNGCSAIESTR